jgi:hypothetical protein
MSGLTQEQSRLAAEPFALYLKSSSHIGELVILDEREGGLDAQASERQ